MLKEIAGSGAIALLLAAPLLLVTPMPVDAQQQASPVATPAAATTGRRVARTQDDLPRHSYPVVGTAEELLAADDAIFSAWASKVAADVDATLRDYDITDAAARRRLLGTRLAYQMLTGRNREALATVREARALEDKPDARLTSGLRNEAILQARLDTGATSGPAFEQRYALLYRQALAAVPFAIAGNALKEAKGRTDLMSAAMTAGYIVNEVQPKVARDHAVGDSGAGDILAIRGFRRIEAPLKSISAAALAQVIAANRVDKPEIWAARDVILTMADHATPVIVAIWDSGIDTALFPKQLYTAGDHDPVSPIGLAFDIESRPTTGSLRPLTAAQAATYASMLADFQGFSDLRSAIDSPASDALKAKLAGLQVGRTAEYLEQLNFYGDYLHGTHVAGIAARGNPFVRLATIRDTYDYNPVPPAPTDATVGRRVALYRTVSRWLKANKVRIVNMSWGETPSSYETDLEKNGIGRDAAERQAMARRFFATARSAFAEILASNPNTVFVCSAGNSGADNGFEEAYPSALVAPNLLVVSAVDQAGDETSFTSNGRNVAVSASGYQVVSSVPGGSTLAESGTSMASPNVVNLAAKLIALQPSLNPAQTIALIRAGATASSDGRRHNINPRASMAALRTDNY